MWYCALGVLKSLEVSYPVASLLLGFIFIHYGKHTSLRCQYRDGIALMFLLEFVLFTIDNSNYYNRF